MSPYGVIMPQWVYQNNYLPNRFKIPRNELTGPVDDINLIVVIYNETLHSQHHWSNKEAYNWL